MFHQILPDALVQAGGWTILHSLWQGVLITLLLAFFLGRTRDRSPALRYQLSVGALFLLLGAVAFTFFQYFQPISPFGASTFEGDAGATGTFYSSSGTTATSLQKRLVGVFPILLQVWLVGVAFMALRMLGELAYLQRLRFSSQAVDENWTKRLDELSRQIGIRQYVDLKENLRVSSPMLVGLIKPVILLPIGMLSGLSVQQVECVLAHELAHVRRMDYLVNLLQSVVEVLLFFNPAVWWISAQIREEREHCCDEMAVALTGNRVILVKTLAQLEEWRLQKGQLGLAFNGRPQGVLGRVQRLLGGESSVRIIGKGLWSLLIFSLVVGLLAFRNPTDASTINGDWENVEITNGAVENRLEGSSSPSMETQKEALSRAEQVAVENDQAEILTDRGLIALASLPEYVAKTFVNIETVRSEDVIQAYRDTIPKEKIQKEMQALEKEMAALQNEMMNSDEMKQMQELAQKYELEMRAMHEKLMAEHGDYQKLMEEQQEMAKKMERKHRDLMESEAFKSLTIERQRLAAAYEQRMNELSKRYEDEPDLLEKELDSLSLIIDRQHEAFEKKYHKEFEAFEKEMEAMEDSPIFKELELKMDAINDEMEKMMDVEMNALEEQMEKLEVILEERFERQMERLSERMEKLQLQWRKAHDGRKEE